MNVQVKKLLSSLSKAQQLMDWDTAEQNLQTILNLKDTLNEGDKKEVLSNIDKLLHNDIERLKNRISAYKERQNATKIIVAQNEYDMKEWATISQYARLFGFQSTMAVSNQIRRGKIPAHRVVTIPELDIKLIRLP